VSTPAEDIIQIRPVKRESAKLVIGLAAPSGEGKTYSALLLALGLAGGDAGKVGLLDTENRRGSLYSDIFSKPFMIGDLVPPFSPARYIQAMRQFAAAGVEALVIDSMSHEHEGEGGIEEIAHSAIARGKKVADWIGAKREHKRFMNALLFLPCHVVCCFRAREKSDFKNGSQPISLGIQPVCEKNVLYEMTASFLLSDKGHHRQEIKLPECLRPILGSEGYLTADHGQKLRDWAGGADPVERARNVLRLAASNGTESLKTAFMALDKATKTTLIAFKDTLKDLAAHADEDGKARPENGAPETPEERPLDPRGTDSNFTF
jgi:AAA domain